jgi:hypothetical protein
MIALSRREPAAIILSAEREGSQEFVKDLKD